MARRKSTKAQKNRITKQHTFGSLIIVLAGIFAVGALGMNSGFWFSEQASNNLAGQAISNAALSDFRCGYDASTSLVVCGPGLDGRRYENTVNIPLTEKVVGVHYDGTLVNYKGNYVVISCSEVKDGCVAGHSGACKIKQLCQNSN